MRVSLRWLSDYIALPTQDADELKSVLDLIGHHVESVEVARGRLVRRLCGAGRPNPSTSQRRQGSPLHGQHGKRTDRGGLWRLEFRGGGEGGLRGAGGGAAWWDGDRPTPNSWGRVGRDDPVRTRIGSRVTITPASWCSTPMHLWAVDFSGTVALPDVIFDLEITSNRPDAMSMVGIARELSAYYDIPYTFPPIEPPTSGEDIKVTVRIEDPTGCYRFVARELRGAKIAPSPFWMRQRLRAAGVRPISNVVDVTQLRDARAGPAAPCLRSRQGDRRVDHRSASEARGRSSSPSTGWSGSWSRTIWSWPTPSRRPVWRGPWEERNRRFRRQRAGC